MLPWFLHPGAFSSKQHSPPPNPQLGPTYRAPISSKNHSQNSCVLFAQDEQGDLSLAVAEAIREGRWASLLAEPSVFFLARRVITASSPRSPESVNRASDRSLSLTPSPPSRAAKTSRSAPARVATKPKRSAAPPPPPPPSSVSSVFRGFSLLSRWMLAVPPAHPTRAPPRARVG